MEHRVSLHLLLNSTILPRNDHELSLHAPAIYIIMNHSNIIMASNEMQMDN